MPRVPISQLHSGSSLVKQTFLLRSKTLGVTRNGSSMLKVTLADRTGSLPGIMFDAPGFLPDTLQVGGGVSVTGRVTEYGISSR